MRSTLPRFRRLGITPDGIEVLERGPGLEPTAGLANAAYVINNGSTIIVEPLMLEAARRLFFRCLAEAREARARSSLRR